MFQKSGQLHWKHGAFEGLFFLRPWDIHTSNLNSWKPSGFWNVIANLSDMGNSVDGMGILWLERAWNFWYSSLETGNHPTQKQRIILYHSWTLDDNEQLISTKGIRIHRMVFLANGPATPQHDPNDHLVSEDLKALRFPSIQVALVVRFLWSDDKKYAVHFGGKHHSMQFSYEWKHHLGICHICLKQPGLVTHKTTQSSTGLLKAEKKHLGGRRTIEYYHETTLCMKLLGLHRLS